MSWSPSLRVYDVASQSPNHMSSHVFEKVLGSYLERFLPYPEQCCSSLASDIQPKEPRLKYMMPDIHLAEALQLLVYTLKCCT